MTDKKQEMDALELIAQGQKDLFNLKKNASRRFEMIVYPAILGMFIMAGVFFGVLFTMISNVEKRFDQKYASCEKPSVTKTHSTDKTPSKLYRVKDEL